ncbi:MAG: hypothetical protein WC325_11670 [Candidatus Bathyarchaeia archaeon]|jgi:hypothetical protein
MINQTDDPEREEILKPEIRKITDRHTSKTVVTPKRWDSFFALFKAEYIEFRTFKDSKGEVYGEIRLLTKQQAEEIKKKEEDKIKNGKH